MSNKQYDVVVYGATGFTGQLVVEYLAQHYPTSTQLKWAIAGRNLQKLSQIKEQYNVDSSIDSIHADAEDIDSLANMVKSCKVVLTTVGPYQLYGNELVELCANNGTD